MQTRSKRAQVVETKKVIGEMISELCKIPRSAKKEEAMVAMREAMSDARFLDKLTEAMGDADRASNLVWMCCVGDEMNVDNVISNLYFYSTHYTA